MSQQIPHILNNISNCYPDMWLGQIPSSIASALERPWPLEAGTAGLGGCFMWVASGDS